MTTQVDVLGAIRNIVEQFGTAGIYITHDLAVVSQMADQIKVLRHGVSIEEPSMREMLSFPNEEYTRTLWAMRDFRKSNVVSKDADHVPELGNVTAHNGVSKVLESIDLKLVKGQTAAVVSERGTGKSTLARVISGLLPPTKGENVFGGSALPRALKQQPKTLIQRIQFVRQTPDTSMNPAHRIRDILGRPLSYFNDLQGTAKQGRLHELLTMIELDPDTYLHRFPAELSGGQ